MNLTIAHSVGGEIAVMNRGNMTEQELFRNARWVIVVYVLGTVAAIACHIALPIGQIKHPHEYLVWYIGYFLIAMLTLIWILTIVPIARLWINRRNSLTKAQGRTLITICILVHLVIVSAIFRTV